MGQSAARLGHTIGGVANVPLHEFVAVYREEIIQRCRVKVATRSTPQAAEPGTNHGVPLFLEQLVDALRHGLMSNPQIGESAVLHGHDLHLLGYTLNQVVHDYGDICQSITDLAVEMDAPISTDDFRTLNRCLDEAIAGAVSEHGRENVQDSIVASARGSERLGFLDHEVRNLTNTAIAAMDVLETGSVGITGSTGALLHRSLMGIRALIGRSLAEVRLTQRVQHREQFLVSGFIEGLAPAAALEAQAVGVTLTVSPVQEGVVIDADRQVLAAVVGNLLQNAFKFTKPGTTVLLRVAASAERVLIEIQDECGGLPAGSIDELFRASEHRSADQIGVGLGLAFSRWGVEANDGRICAHNLPHHQGCVFTVDLPRLPVSVPAVSHSWRVAGLADSRSHLERS